MDRSSLGPRLSSALLALMFVLSAFGTGPGPVSAQGTTPPVIEWEVGLGALPGLGAPSTPQIVDLDGDGTNEIVLTSGASIYALRPDGTTKWRYTIEGTAIDAISHDINSDGKAEVVAVSEDGTVYCLNQDGAQLWTFDPGAAVRGTPAIVDLDGDGRSELVFGTLGKVLYAVKSTGATHWKTDLSHPVRVSVTVAPLKDKGEPELIVADDQPTLRFFDKDGQVEWSTPLPGVLVEGPAIADIDMNGHLDPISMTEDGKLTDHNSVEFTTVDLKAKGTAPVLMDLDDDGTLEVIVGDASGNLSVYEHDGELSYRYGQASAVVGVIGVHAPGPSIVMTTRDGTVSLLGPQLQKVWSIDTGLELNDPPTAADVDGDQEMELVVAGVDGDVVLIDTHAVMERAWPMSGHDLRHTRALSATDDGHLRWHPKWMNFVGGGNITITEVVVASQTGGKEVVLLGWDDDLNESTITIFGPDGGTKGTIHIQDEVSAGPLAANLVGGTGDEIVFANQSGIHVVDGDLLSIWDHPLQSPTGALAAADLIGDGRYEIFAGNDTGTIVVLDPLSGTPLWSDDLGSGIRWLTVADLGTDGEMEVMVSTDNDIMFVMKALNGSLDWSSKVIPGPLRPPTVADLDGDSRTDILMGSEQGRLVAYGGNGTELWTKDLVGPIVSSIAVHGEDGLDLAVTNPYELSIIDGNNGSVLSTRDITEWYQGPSPLKEGRALASYLGTKGPVEVLVPEYGSLLNAAKEREDVWNMSVYPGPGPVLTADLDEDGSIELVVASFLGAIRTYDMGIDAGSTVPWTTTGHDPARTYNPFSSSGRFLPDLGIGPADITFEPPLISDEGTVTVEITYRNQGSVATSGFNISATSKGQTITNITVPSMDAFSEATTSFEWNVGYENVTLEVELDKDHIIEEAREDDNKASRTLFMNLRPVANAGTDRDVDPSEVIAFDGALSYDPDGTIVNYTWDLGDGNMAYGLVVSHAYSGSGAYVVTLQVTDNYGALGQDNLTVDVNHPPYFMDWYPKNDPSVNEGENVDFWVLASDADGDGTTVEWYLDEVLMNEGPALTIWANYSSSGLHEVVARVSDGRLTIDLFWDLTIVESFRLIDGVDPEGPVTIPEAQSRAFTVFLSPAAQGAQVEWLLDGATVHSDSNVFGLFAGEGTAGDYELMVEVTSDTGRDFHIWDVTIGPTELVPTIRWAYPEESNITVEAGTPVWFGVAAEDGNIQWYVNGAAVLGQDGPGFKFDDWGNSSYEVEVKVSSGSSSISQAWTVNLDYPPVAVIKASKMTVRKGGKVSFDGSGSRALHDNDTITSYEWDFGDGELGNGPSVDHSYRKAGTYEAVLKVTDSNGLSTRAKVTIIVKPDVEATPGLEATALILGLVIIVLIRRRSRRSGSP